LAGLSRRTCRRRLADPTFKQKVAALRREHLDRLLGRRSGASALAAAELVRLTKEAKSEGVRLAAARTLLVMTLKTREAVGAEGIQEDLVLAAEFAVLQAGAVGEGIGGEGEDVVGLVRGEVEREQVQVVVDDLDAADLAGQGVADAEAAAAEAAGARGDRVVASRSGAHGSVTARSGGLVEATRDAALAVGAWASYLGLHLKSLRTNTGFMGRTIMKPRKRPRDFKLFRFSWPER
jgi:hypothetical protein